MPAPRIASGLALTLTLAGGVATAAGCTASDQFNFGGGPILGEGCGSSSGMPGSSGFCGGDDVGGVTHPSFSSTPVQATVPPPPISGGTLIALNDGRSAVAADPDRDAVYIVDVSQATPPVTITLRAGDEPGRLVEDGAGRVHVALRGSGGLVTIDPVAATVLWRRSVCPAPRGVAWDKTTDLVWVACATGELVALPAGGGDPVSSVVVERDLRDVVIGPAGLTVTKFRSAEVLQVSSDGQVTKRYAVPDPIGGFECHVAWRTVLAPDGSVVVVHQCETQAEVDTTIPGGYGGSMGGPSSVVESAVTRFGPSGTTSAVVVDQAVLPVDVAVSPAGDVSVVAPGNAYVPGLPVVFSFDSGLGSTGAWTLDFGAQPTAAAYDAAGDLLVQTREPAALYVIKDGGDSYPIFLGQPSRDDTGHDIFHVEAGGMIACGSCHPEGGDDGFIWNLDGNSRRTPSLRGTVAGTAPYHWPGDEPDLDALANDVYTNRMNGTPLDTPHLGALESWVQTIPAPPAPSWLDAASVQRGEALFRSGSVGCSTCHTGPKLTNNLTLDVGTGGAFQVPPLVGVGWRTPLLHDGCATTLADRFGKCATPTHGNLAGLAAQDVTDLVSYLDSL